MSIMETRSGPIPWREHIVSLYLMSFSIGDPQEAKPFGSWKACPTNFFVSRGCMAMMHI